MKLNEILSNGDYAGILANLLKKSISPKFLVAMDGETNVLADRPAKLGKAAGALKGHRTFLAFRIRVSRYGSAFHIVVTYSIWDFTYKRKTMQEVVELINEIDADPTAWILSMIGQPA